MSRLIAAILILLLLAGFCITDYFYVGKSYDKFSKSVQICEQERSREAAGQLYDEWVAAEPTLSIFVNHAILEDVSESVAKLPRLAEGEETSELLAECDVIKLKLQYIKEDSRVNLHSLF